SLALVVLVLARRPAAGLAIAVAATAGVSWLAVGFDRGSAHAMRTNVLPADVRWVDHAGLKNVGMLLLPGSERGRALDQLFWNRSVTDVLRIGTPKVDGYSQP